MSTICFVALLSSTNRFYGKHSVKWIPFGDEQTKAREFAKGKGLEGKDAYVHIQLDTDSPPSQKEACVHEMLNYGNADRVYQEGGEYWADYTCIHCGNTFSVWAGPMMGR